MTKSDFARLDNGAPYAAKQIVQGAADVLKRRKLPLAAAFWSEKVPVTSLNLGACNASPNGVML